MLLGGRVWQFPRRLPGEVPVDRALIEPRFCADYSSHRRHTAGTTGDACLSAIPQCRLGPTPFSEPADT